MADIWSFEVVVTDQGNSPYKKGTRIVVDGDGWEEGLTIVAIAKDNE